MFFVLLCFGIMFMSGFEQINIIDYIDKCDKINVTYNGSDQIYVKGSKEYQNILNGFIEMCLDGYEMPAFGVSLNETKNNFKNKLMIEFVFDNVQTYLDMPFDTLLILIDSNNCGFDIRRGQNGIYAGRNYYFSLKGNMKSFYQLIMKEYVD